MIRNSFTVGYRLRRVHHTVLGVTSIVPNLNGVLLFTEDGENHFIESCDMEHHTLPGMYIEYSTDDDIWDERELAQSKPGEYEIHDHRRHWQDPC